MLQDEYALLARPSVGAFAQPDAPALASLPATFRHPWSLLDSPSWRQVGEDGFVPDFPSAGRLVVPVALWQARRIELLQTGGPLGLLIHEEDEPAAVGSDLNSFELIVVVCTSNQRRVPIARSLRERYGYAGLLAALDLRRDRSAASLIEGFDAFARRLPSATRFKLEQKIELEPQ